MVIDFLTARSVLVSAASFAESRPQNSRNVFSNGDSLSRRQASDRWNFGVVTGSGRKTTSDGNLANIPGNSATPNPEDTNSRMLVGRRRANNLRLEAGLAA